MKHLLIAASLCFAGSAQAGLRCEKGIVSEGQRSSEVLIKCGEPASRSVVGYTKDASLRTEVQMEEWVYGPREGGMMYFLKFEGGLLKKVDSKRG
ncbi:MAG: DUF2845 domain-containing protein [Pseudomonas sp.]|uniref:DUF2845 domain-containing protein n=1 Tax=Pseudomonas sp. TaxID=306 RepID=UPI003391F38C